MASILMRARAMVDRIEAWEREENRPILCKFAAICHLLYDTARQIITDQIFRGASALAFTTILALVPLLAVSFAALKVFVSSDELALQVRQWILGTLLADSVSQLNEVIETFLSRAQGSAVGFIGFVFLLYSSISLFFTIEKTINQMWRVPPTRPLHRRVTTFYAVITLAPALIALGFLGATWITGALGSIVSAQVAGSFFQWFMLIAAFTLLYKVMPHTIVSWKAALVGGIFGVIGFQLLRWGFNFYVSSMFKGSANAKIYGGFALVPVFCLWVQLVWTVILAGVSISFSVHHHALSTRNVFNYGSRNGEKSVLNGYFLTRIFFEIALHFETKGGGITSEEIASRLCLSTSEVLPPLNVLRAAKLVLVSQGSDSSVIFTPARALCRIPVFELESLCESQGYNPGDLPCVTELRAMEDLLKNARDARLSSLSMSVSDVLNHCTKAPEVQLAVPEANSEVSEFLAEEQQASEMKSDLESEA